jgi:hypothetical protein
VVLAEGDDKLFVLVRERIEFVQFHTAMFLAAGMGVIARTEKTSFRFVSKLGY